jgi:hypothetical protein
MEKGRIKSKGSKFLMDAFQFLGISRRNRVPNNRFLFKLRSSKVKYNIVTCLQVILTPTCRVSGYPRQVIEVDAA